MGKVVDKEDLTRHDKWLCMMMPRLKLLRELLSEDGVIFISIDDNEQHNLRCLLDEVFGAENFLANVIWQHSIQGKNDAKGISLHHNYTLIYKKPLFQISKLDRTEEHNVAYSNPDDDPMGLWRSGDVRSPNLRENLKYDIETPSGKKISPPEYGWRWDKNNVLSKIKTGEIIFNEDETKIIRKIYLQRQDGRIVESIWFGKDVGTTRDANATLKEIFTEELPFETPKPVNLVKRIIQITTDENDIILDSFSGSGTTAQAVLELNKEDDGNRKFILVEMEDYANSVTAERVRRTIKGLDTSKNENLKNGLGGSFSYFQLGDPIEMESLLKGNNLPTYTEFARYIFYTATGYEFEQDKINTETGFIGETNNYEVYMFYKPDIEWLKRNALTLDTIQNMPKYKGKKRLVFAPAKYVDDTTCDYNHLDFCQLPYEIYRIQQ